MLSFLCIFCWLQISWSYSYVVPYWAVFGELIRQVFRSFLTEYVKMILSYYFLHQIKSHVYCSGFFLPFPSRCYFPLCCQLKLALVVVGVPFLIVQSVCMWLFGSVKKISLIPPHWLIPGRFSWYRIPLVLDRFLGAFQILVCFCLILGWGKNTHLLFCMSLVLRCGVHLNIYVGSSRFC